MEPADVPVLLQQELIELLPCTIRNVQQDHRITDHLLLTRTADIHRTARHMIACRHTSSEFIHRRRAIARVNHDPLHILRRLIILARLQAVQRVITIPQFLQPPAEPLQILNHFVTRNILIRRHMLGFRKLSERHVLGELCLLINTYFVHITCF